MLTVVLQGRGEWWRGACQGASQPLQARAQAGAQGGEWGERHHRGCRGARRGAGGAGGGGEQETHLQQKGQPGGDLHGREDEGKELGVLHLRGPDTGG